MPEHAQPNLDSEPLVPHQFDDLEQKSLADSLGMWTFLASEVLFFGAIFTVLMVYRSLFPDAFRQASQHLDRRIGMLNTFVLLFSSYTVVLAVHAALKARQKALVLWLLATIALGLSFLGVKLVEYAEDFRDNLVPRRIDFGLSAEQSRDWMAHSPEERDTRPELWQQSLRASGWDVPADRMHASDARLLIKRAQLFFVFYYTMTLIHALHMIIGLVIFSVLAWRAWHGRYTQQRHAQIEITGLYWHFVDIVWIFLFPLLYLIR